MPLFSNLKTISINNKWLLTMEAGPLEQWVEDQKWLNRIHVAIELTLIRDKLENRHCISVERQQGASVRALRWVGSTLRRRVSSARRREHNSGANLLELLLEAVVTRMWLELLDYFVHFRAVNSETSQYGVYSYSSEWNITTI